MLLYYRDRSLREMSARLNPLLGLLRFLTGSIITFLLLAPFVKSKETRVQKPVVVIAQDVSESIASAMDSATLPAYRQKMLALRDALAEAFDVKTYSFGARVRDSLSFDFRDKITNISDVLETVYNDLDRRTLGAVIVATDGIFNEGSAPNYVAGKLAVPVYSIALGDTTPRQDIRIRRIFHNNIAYLGDQIEAQVDIAADHLPAGTTTALIAYQVTSGGLKKIGSSPVKVDKDNFFTTVRILLPMEKSGVNQFRFVVNPVAGEAVKANNSRDIYIDVLDSRLKILILADAPHPDLAAMKRSLEQNKNYEVSVRFAGKFDGQVGMYDLVILHQLPSRAHAVAATLRQLMERHIPRLFVVGARTDLGNLNHVQDMVAIRTTGPKPNLVQAAWADNFAAFTLDDRVKQQLPGFNPLTAPFGTYQAGPRARVLMYQRIGKVKTDYPLWVVQDADGVKSGIITAEGLWRWRLFDFMQHQNHDIFDQVFNKTVNFLAVKRDKRRFRVDVSNHLVNENDPILFHAELYNDNYELVNEPDVNLTVFDASGKRFPFVFSRKDKTYVLDAGAFPPGRYRYTARTQYDGRNYTASGKFSVRQIDQEKYNTTANHNVLYLMSQAYGGRVIRPDSLDRLAPVLAHRDSLKPVLYETTRNRPLLYSHWLLALLVGLLALEWFLRKYFGGY